MSDFQKYFFDKVSELIVRSNDKYSCIEDQFYFADNFPKYEQDDEIVFKCEACKCLLHVNYLTECDFCRENYCDFKHTNKSICHERHDCAKLNLREKYSPASLTTHQICAKCLQSKRRRWENMD